MKHIRINGLDIRAINGGALGIQELPDHAIALDGAVQGPVMGNENDCWSFDHHAACSRLITDATCQQVHKAIVLGLDVSDRPIFINDIDGDTLMSLWLLANPSRADTEYVYKLVRAVGTIDAHGPAGAHLLTNEEEAMSNALFARLRDWLPRNVQAEYESWASFIEKGFQDIEHVILDAFQDKLESNQQDPPQIERLFEGKRGGVNAIIAKSEGFGGFMPLYQDGFRVVVLVSDAADGSQRYTIGKLSDLVAYPLGPGNDTDSLLGRLNAREPGWGGGSSIGGSPRLEGGVSSRLSPEDVWELMDR